MSPETFEKLTNEHGLVRMRMRTDMAPYYADTIAGFSPTNAFTLYSRKWAVPVDEDGIEFSPEEPPPAETPPKPGVAIPLDWASQHHLQRIRLARELGSSAKTAEEADAFISAEVDRRKQLQQH